MQEPRAGPIRPSIRRADGSGCRASDSPMTETSAPVHDAGSSPDSRSESAILAKTNRELQALVAFSRAAGAAQTVEQVAREIAHAIRGGFGFDRAAVFLSEGEGLRGVIGTDMEGHDEDGRSAW